MHDLCECDAFLFSFKALTMRGSAFVKPCETEVRQWYDKLYRVNRTFEQWGKVQISWLYLKPIFSSEDIIAQMPRENELYVQVDKIYRKYINVCVVLSLSVNFSYETFHLNPRTQPKNHH